MTASLVVDASAFIAVLFKEAEGYALVQRWDGRRIVAPQLLSYEVANVTLVKMRRNPQLRDGCAEAYEHFTRAKIDFAEVDFPETLRLAERRGLTAYDASYVWLALARQLDLVSLDRRMIEAFDAERSA